MMWKSYLVGMTLAGCLPGVAMAQTTATATGIVITDSVTEAPPTANKTGAGASSGDTPLPPSAAPSNTPSAPPLADRLDAIFNAPQWSSAHWGVLVKDVDSSAILYAHEPDKSVMPASNMKLFTTAASLATLGADYKFETKIYASGTTDTAGTLHGNIYIVGSGDPSISGRYLDTPTTAILAQWADAITSAGIKRIEGNIVGDDDIFDDSYIGGSWMYDYLQEWYAAENSGLAINENCWDTMLYPVASYDGLSQATQEGLKKNNKFGRGISYIDPLDTKYYTIHSQIERTTKTAGRDDGYISIKRLPESNTISLTGHLPTESKPTHEWGSIHNGTLFTVTLLKEELDRRGVSTGRPTDIDDMDKQMAAWLKAHPGQLIHTHVSPPLSEIIAMVNKPSQNFYADMLLKVIGAKAHDLGSWENGQKVVEDLLTTAGAAIKSFHMSDGSGLSRRNLIEPNQVVALLSYMQTRPDFEVFKASLPIMGIDGTLKGRMTGTPAEGKVHAKTGTIGGVRSLSGYLTNNSGHRIVFCMIANNFYLPTSAATEAQNQAVLELLKQ